jgi:hypothetical protein
MGIGFRDDAADFRDALSGPNVCVPESRVSGMQRSARLTHNARPGVSSTRRRSRSSSICGSRRPRSSTSCRSTTFRP